MFSLLHLLNRIPQNPYTQNFRNGSTQCVKSTTFTSAQTILRYPIPPSHKCTQTGVKVVD